MVVNYVSFIIILFKLYYFVLNLKGQCVQLTSSSAYCQCSPGFTGQRCESSLTPSTQRITTTPIPLLIDACATGLIFCQNGKTSNSYFFLLNLSQYFLT